MPDATGRTYLSVSPLTTTFGCSNTVGYQLTMQGTVVHKLYLPLIDKES